MARLTDFTIELLESGRVRVSWTGTSGLRAWIGLDGRLAPGMPLAFGGETDRQSDLTVDELFAIELHEGAVDEFIRVIETPRAQHPVIHWTPVAGAALYNIYHQPGAGEAERFIQSEPHRNGNGSGNGNENGHYAVRIRRDLQQRGARWHRFRVEAHTSADKESAGAPHALWLTGLPQSPSDAQLTGTSPNLSLTLTL